MRGERQRPERDEARAGRLDVIVDYAACICRSQLAATIANVVVVACGDQRVSEKKVKALVGGPIERAEAEFVRQATGYAIGGVSPLGQPGEVILLLDALLQRFATVWAAAGTPFSVFPLAPADLQRLTGAPWADVIAKSSTVRWPTVDAATAKMLALETFAGALALAESSPESVATLRARVTSPGGTTERAIASFDAAQLKAVIGVGVNACQARSVELGELLAKG